MSLSHHHPISVPAAEQDTPAHTLRGRAHLAVGLLSFLVVVVLGSAHGGYDPTAWGWSVLAFVWLAGIAFLRAGRGEVSRIELVFLGALALFVGWMALSIVWTSNVEASVLEVQRGLVYVFGALAALLIARRRAVAPLLAGLVAGTTWLALQALADRLSPDVPAGIRLLDQARLEGALGYANGFALLCVLGALLALGFAVHGRSLAGRAAAAAVLPVLLTTTYFTFSRGAALAVAAGLLAAFAGDRRRLELLTAGVIVTLPSAAALWIASRAPALTSSRASADLITDEGRTLALELLGLTAGSALLAVLVGLVASRVRVPRAARRTYGAVLACVAVAALAGVVIDQGGPVEVAERAYNGVNKDKVAADQAEANNLNSRLASIGTSPRVNYWRVALDEHQAHPWIGSGAGTYEQFWLRDRPIGEAARDGHSLYLETLAQLGWPGLVLLLGMLALPLAAAVHARGDPLVAGALGAYVAYLVHTGVDWDWEMPVLTLFALLCAAALFAAAREPGAGTRPAIAPRLRALAAVATIALAAFAVVGLVGNRALAKADNALKRQDFAAAEQAARSAERWAPWSAQARRQRGRAELGLGRAEQARDSLREAARMSPDDWRIWYDLGIASAGRQRERAFVKAATLNPMEDDIEALRKQGYRLPPERPAP
jgi:tetratricopeptide (TPR) repeat protein